jgi:hypothetical protein
MGAPSRLLAFCAVLSFSASVDGHEALQGPWEDTYIACPDWGTYITAHCAMGTCDRDPTDAEGLAICAEFRDSSACSNDPNALRDLTTRCATSTGTGTGTTPEDMCAGCHDACGCPCNDLDGCGDQTCQDCHHACDGWAFCSSSSSTGTTHDEMHEPPTCNFAALMVRPSTPPAPTRILPAAGWSPR